MGSEQDAAGSRSALIIGSTGIVGQNLAHHLLDRGWQVSGLSRGSQVVEGVHGLQADLEDADSVKRALQLIAPTHVFLCAWIRQPTEAENVRVNGDLVRNVLAALDHAPLNHAALVTGTKQYLGPFENYGQTAAETPFREDTPRLPGENFYYTQEDVLFASAASAGFTWSVHRPHTIIGYAIGNAMNMGSTLAVYASLCRERGEPFLFPGSEAQWNFITDITDARLLATHLEWAATSASARDEAFNVVNGDVFRWRWLWPQLAGYFGLEWQGPPSGGSAPLEPRMTAAQAEWVSLATENGLREQNIARLASWWHTDGDLGRTIECVNDMSKSRRLGFLDHQPTPQSFFDLFDRMVNERLIPPPR